MKYLFTKICLLGLSVYAVLCVQGVMKGPSDPWTTMGICIPILFILALEDK